MFITSGNWRACGKPGTTRCRVAPVQTNPRRREGDPRRLELPHYDEHRMPLLSLESAAMLCRVDSRGRLGLLLRRQVGPLAFPSRRPRAVSASPFPRAVDGFVASTPMVTCKGLLVCRMCSPFTPLYR